MCVGLRTGSHACLEGFSFLALTSLLLFSCFAQEKVDVEKNRTEQDQDQNISYLEKENLQLMKEIKSLKNQIKALKGALGKEMLA
jgi:peptidoglycan hydrolase CwlO-like protein